MGDPKTSWQRPLVMGWVLVFILIFLIAMMTGLSGEYGGNNWKDTFAYKFHKWTWAVTSLSISIAFLCSFMWYPSKLKQLNIAILLPFIPFILYCLSVVYMHRLGIFF